AQPSHHRNTLCRRSRFSHPSSQTQTLPKMAAVSTRRKSGNQKTVVAHKTAEMNQRVLALLALALTCLAHEGHRNFKPTKAAADLKKSREALAAAKRKLAAQGRYACCLKASYSLCTQMNESCNCGANVATEQDACGECYAEWKG